jgi:hypothetical protein
VTELVIGRHDTMGVNLSLSPAIASTGALMALSQLSYSAASLNNESACRWNALQIARSHHAVAGIFIRQGSLEILL